VNNTKTKGVRVERELANKFWQLGFAVVRSGSSGGGVRKRFAPDLVVMRNGKIAVLEVKYRSKDSRVQLDIDRIYKLREFANRAGAKAYIAVKFSNEQWRFVSIEQITQLLENGNNGNSKYIYLTREYVTKNGLTLREFVEREFFTNNDIINYLRDKLSQ